MARAAEQSEPALPPAVARLFNDRIEPLLSNRLAKNVSPRAAHIPPLPSSHPLVPSSCAGKAFHRLSDRNGRPASNRHVVQRLRPDGPPFGKLPPISIVESAVAQSQETTNQTDSSAPPVSSPDQDAVGTPPRFLVAFPPLPGSNGFFTPTESLATVPRSADLARSIYTAPVFAFPPKGAAKRRRPGRQLKDLALPEQSASTVDASRQGLVETSVASNDLACPPGASPKLDLAKHVHQEHVTPIPPVGHPNNHVRQSLHKRYNEMEQRQLNAAVRSLVYQSLGRSARADVVSQPIEASTVTLGSPDISSTETQNNDDTLDALVVEKATEALVVEKAAKVCSQNSPPTSPHKQLSSPECSDCVVLDWIDPIEVLDVECACNDLASLVICDAIELGDAIELCKANQTSSTMWASVNLDSDLDTVEGLDVEHAVNELASSLIWDAVRLSDIREVSANLAGRDSACNPKDWNSIAPLIVHNFCCSVVECAVDDLLWARGETSSDEDELVQGGSSDEGE